MSKPRERILEAAGKLFGEVGFDATTTREIAELSQVNKALIHYHFRSKEGLLGALLDRYYGLLGEVVQKALQGEGELLERMVRLIDAYVDFLGEHRNFARIVQREASGGQHLERIHAQMIPIFSVGTRVLQQAFPNSQSGDLTAEQLLTSFYGMIISTFTYSEILDQLIGKDVFSKEMLEKRKAHLRRMAKIIFEALRSDEAALVESER